jgi:uncharacterized membrane protein YtjA (UPF0391 family)
MLKRQLVSRRRRLQIAERWHDGCNTAAGLLTLHYSFGGISMLRWAVVFLVIALVAAIFGFGGLAADAAWIAKILFFVFLVLFVISLILGRGRGPAV